MILHAVYIVLSIQQCIVWMQKTYRISEFGGRPWTEFSDGQCSSLHWQSHSEQSRDALNKPCWQRLHWRCHWSYITCDCNSQLELSAWTSLQSVSCCWDCQRCWFSLMVHFWACNIVKQIFFYVSCASMPDPCNLSAGGGVEDLLFVK